MVTRIRRGERKHNAGESSPETWTAHSGKAGISGYPGCHCPGGQLVARYGLPHPAMGRFHNVQHNILRSQGQRPVSNAKVKRHYLLFAAIAVVGLAADLATKSYAFSKLGHPSTNGGEVAWVIEGFFGFQTSLNEGALFGLGQGYSWLFIVLAFGAILGIGSWFALGSPGKDKLLTVILAMLMAGIIGNLYDRMGLPAWEGDWTWPVATVNARAGFEHAAGDTIYGVRDFILFRFGTYTWPNFNIADSLLVCGVILMLFHAYVLEPRQRKAATAKSSTSQAAASA